MLPVRWRKVFRDLLVQKAKTVLIIMSISLGVISVGMIGQSHSVLLEGMQKSYNDSHPSHFSLYSEPFDRDIISIIRQTSGIKAVEGRKLIYAKIQGNKENSNTEKQTDWKELQLFASDDFEQTNLNKIYPIKGAWPPPYGEILLEESVLRYYNLKIGSRVPIKIDDHTFHLRIAGTVRDPLRDSPYISGRSYGYISMDTLDKLNIPKNYNFLSLRVEGDEKNTNLLNNLAVQVRDVLNTYGIHVFWLDIPQPGKHWAYDIVHSMALILQGFGLLIILAGSTLTINTVIATLMSQIRQIGVMKVIGADRSTLIRMYLGNITFICITAILIGIPIGMSAAALITKQSINLLNFKISHYEISSTTVILQILVGLVLPLLVALVPVLIGTSIPEREAIGGQTRNNEYGKMWIERILEKIRLLPRPIILSIRNTFRRKSRLFLTLFTLSLGGTVVLSVISVNVSIKSTIEDYLQYSNYDYRITFGSPQPSKEVEQLAMQVAGVRQVESWYDNSALRIRPDGSRTLDWTIFGIPPSSTFLNPSISKGRWLKSGKENEIVLNSYLQRQEPDIQLGDEILLKIGSTEDYWRVVGFFIGPSEIDSYVNKSRLLKYSNAGDVATVMNVKTVKTERNAIAEHAMQLKDFLLNKGIYAYSYLITDDIKKTQQNRYSIITIFLSFLSILLVIVAGLSLMGTMSLNVMERAREIGIMRSIGASNPSILGIVVLEGIIIGGISFLFSVLLAYPVSKLICNQVGMSLFQSPLTYRYPLDGIVFWMVTIVLLSIISSLAPAWKASRLSIKDVLNVE